MIKTLGVIGGGVLGKAVARGFMEWCEVRVYDVDPARRTHSMEEAATSDVVMICLPTPAKPNGECDTSAIDVFLHEAQREEWWRPHSCYCIRSTVPVGYTQEQARRRDFFLPLLHSPEFLTARCSLVDFQIPARNIIGWPVGSESAAGNVVAATILLTALYRQRFPGVPIHGMTSNESELVKLACNSFFAAKVTFFNVLRKAAEANGCDWETVRGGVLSDGRIAHAHTAVPGPSGELGYGGACLPKDLANFSHCVPDDLRFFVDGIGRANGIVRGEK